MRYSQKCPKCDGRVFAVNTEVRQAEQRSSNTTLLVSAITVGFPAERGERTWGGRVELGFFESWICLGCGYAEFYAQKCPLPLETIAQQHPDRLRIVDATAPKDGPYR